MARKPQTKYDRIQETLKKEAKEMGIDPGRVPKFKRTEKRCAYPGCGKQLTSGSSFENVVTGKFYCSVEHSNADQARTD